MSTILEQLSKSGFDAGKVKDNLTANQYYKNTYLKQKGTEFKKSFKDWLADQKANGNVDEAGRIIWEKLVGTPLPTNPDQQMPDYKPDYSNTPKPTQGTKILGMPKPLAIALAVVAVSAIGYGIYVMAKSASKAKS